MREITTHVFMPKSSTAYTTVLKKNTDTRSSAPSLLRIIFILFHTSLALDKFLTTDVQYLFAAKITLPRYRKEVPISRGSP